MDKKNMIEALVRHFTKGNKSKFALMLGVTPQTINTWMARNTFDAELIYAKCEYISGDWLLTGEGAMLKTSTSSESPCNPVVKPLEGGDKGDMLDTINTQAHIIERMQLKIESLEALLKSQNTPYSPK